MDDKSVIIAEREEWNLIKEQAKAALASGLLPRHITKPEQAAIIALKGRELGIPIMEALSSITVIQGKPALSAELMLALIYKRIPGVKVTFITPQDKVNDECSIRFQRPHGDPQIFTFTLNDAKRAGLMSNPSWQKYPAAMLRARCISAMARACAPDATRGCMTPEELGGHNEDFEALESPVVATLVEAVRPIVTTEPRPENKLNAINERFSKRE